MDINYLVNTIIPQRKKEYKQEKNLGTAQPIYVVLRLVKNYIADHTDNYDLSHTNYKGLSAEFGYFDEALDFESKEFKLSNKGMKKPCEVTQFYTDSIVAFFLTSKAAHEYKKYQNHNLGNSYVYVFNSGYANKEMNQFLNKE